MTFQTNLDHIEPYRIFSTLLDHFGQVWNHSGPCWTIIGPVYLKHTFPTFSTRDTQIYTETPSDIQGHPGTSRGPCMSLGVPRCPCVSLDVPGCPLMSLYVAGCLCISLGVPRCHWVSPAVP